MTRTTQASFLGLIVLGKNTISRGGLAGGFEGEPHRNNGALVNGGMPYPVNVICGDVDAFVVFNGQHLLSCVPLSRPVPWSPRPQRTSARRV